jgi:hypothetical protein
MSKQASLTDSTSTTNSRLSSSYQNAYAPKTRCEKAVYYSGYTGSALGAVGSLMADQTLMKSNPKYAAMGIPVRVATCASIIFGMYYVATNAAFYFCPYRADTAPSIRDTSAVQSSALGATAKK